MEPTTYTLTLTRRQMCVLDAALQEECRTTAALDPVTRALPMVAEYEDDLGRLLAFVQSHMPQYTRYTTTG